MGEKVDDMLGLDAQLPKLDVNLFSSGGQALKSECLLLVLMYKTIF